ncbi:uncharacterized protein DS421_16g552910 [Arachis hypogaea]|nr:uncharacterized protein DS421_16g552910 [Arachis hypogaea]
MMIGSRGRSNGTRGRGKGWASTESPRDYQSSPSTPAILSTPVTSQAGLLDQQFILVPNLNWVPPSATPLTDAATMSTNPAVGDNSNAPEQHAPPPPPFIRLRIWLDGMQSCAPNLNACTQEISEVIKSMYDNPWTTYMYYDHRAAKYFQQTMSDVRQGKDHLTSWICPNIKSELKAHFRDNEGFKYRRLMNIANKASPRSSRYTGGSTTFMKTKTRLSKSLDPEATLAETFKYIHTLKANKEKFTDEQLTADYQSRPPSRADKAGSETSVVDHDRIWCKTASKPHKNHRFRYFLAEIEGLEQKSDSEVEKGLLMLLDSDLPALKVDFLELQNSKWRASNCVGK